MLELGDSKLELVPFLPGDEPELTQDAVERGARLLSHANRVAAPARRRVVDPTLHLVAAHSAVSATAPTSASRRRLAGSSMWTRTPPLPPALALRLRGRCSAAVAAVD